MELIRMICRGILPVMAVFSLLIEGTDGQSVTVPDADLQVGLTSGWMDCTITGNTIAAVFWRTSNKAETDVNNANTVIQFNVITGVSIVDQNYAGRVRLDDTTFRMTLLNITQQDADLRYWCVANIDGVLRNNFKDSEILVPQSCSISSVDSSLTSSVNGFRPHDTFNTSWTSNGNPIKSDDPDVQPKGEFYDATSTINIGAEPDTYIYTATPTGRAYKYAGEDSIYGCNITLKVSDLCDPNPCENGATCNPNNGETSCECLDGYRGVFCETDPNEELNLIVIICCSIGGLAIVVVLAFLVVKVRRRRQLVLSRSKNTDGGGSKVVEIEEQPNDMDPANSATTD